MAKRLTLIATVPLSLLFTWLVATQPFSVTPLEQLLYLAGYMISTMAVAYGLGWIDE
jgi:ABC-type Fe3+ transport system permease subunit